MGRKHRIAQLYRESCSRPVESFRDFAFGILRQELDFDFAVWAIGSVRGWFPPHVLFDYRSAAAPVTGCVNGNCEQRLSWQRDLRLLGITVLASPFAASPTGDASTPAACRRCYPNALTTAIDDGVTGLYNALAVFRRASSPVFTEAERQAKETLAPHLIASAGLNLLALLRRNKLSADFACAICDPQGFVHVADESFGETLRAEWPQWNGQRVPLAVMAGRVGEQRHRYVGPCVTICLEPLEGWLHVCARATVTVQ